MNEAMQDDFQVIPAIDLLDGGCVRLYQGDFEQVSEYSADPVEVALRYKMAGTNLLHVVDLDGARSGAATNLDILRQLVTETGLAVQTGGGIRNPENARERLDCGVERIVIGSLAVREPEIVAGWLEELGAERLVLGLDVRIDAGVPYLLTHGWTETDGRTLWELMDYYGSRGACHYLCTDISRDGTLQGPNTALYAEMAQRYPAARIQASGGVASAADLAALSGCGAAAAITGKALLDGRITIEELSSFSPGE